ncbi:pseudouridine synthase [Muriicola sp. Z0-33]|uniref:pseudouridine synthase n=1 Tax=Muriicola sp. Z0-33 TaxID=2816957 RepID=UPI0022381015|nr:pseudouridine synthase [Muriicola sp. Z0-33]MCW5515259.1 pseudouridine synthase [Muriicola sp. Z0-33]
MKKEHYHFKVYKPFGMLSQLKSNNHKETRTKRFLSELYNFPEGTMAIGRLDEKSEGLLFLTTDGKRSDIINRSGIEKEYFAQLDGIITESAIEALEKGVVIGFEGKKYKTKQCKATLLQTPPDLPLPNSKLRIGRHRPTSWIKVVITEGKFRQLRKMTAAVGYPTVRLIRTRIGNTLLRGMQPGDVLAEIIDQIET